MSDTGFHIFDRSMQKTNRVLTKIEEEFGWEGRRDQTYTALRKVLHTLRDRLQVDSSVNFAAQLPLMLKGVYFDGWDPSDVPVKMDKQEFLDAVQKNFNYSVEGGIERVVQVVLRVVTSQMNKDIVDDLKEGLPQDIGELL